MGGGKGAGGGGAASKEDCGAEDLRSWKKSFDGSCMDDVSVVVGWKFMMVMIG